jgi:tetratricopeptide (TPR) repeat protein
VGLGNGEGVPAIEQTADNVQIKLRAMVSPTVSPDLLQLQPDWASTNAALARPRTHAPPAGKWLPIALSALVIILVIALATVLMHRPSHEGADTASKTVAQLFPPAPAVPAAATAPLVAPVDGPAPAPAAASTAQANESPAARVEAEPDRQAQMSTGGSVTIEILSELLQRSASDDWNVIDQRVRSVAPVSHSLGDRKSARESNRIGLELFQKGRFDAAAAEFRKGLDASPGDIEVRNNLAFSTLRDGRHEQAVSLLTETLMADPTRASAWGNLAEAFAEMGKVPASRAAVKLVVHFSRNQQKSMEFLLSAEKVESEKLRSVIAGLAPELERVPAFVR